MNDQTNMAQLRYLEELKIGLVHADLSRSASRISICPSDGKKGASTGSPAEAACCTGRSVSTSPVRRTHCRPSSISLP